MEASVPRYIRPLCLTESQSEGDGRKKGGKWERRWRRKESELDESYLVFGLWACGRRVHAQHFWKCARCGGGRDGRGKFGCKRDVRQGACLLGSVAAYFKEGIGVPKVCFAWLKHEQCVCFPQKARFVTVLCHVFCSSLCPICVILIMIWTAYMEGVFASRCCNCLQIGSCRPVRDGRESVEVS